MSVYNNISRISPNKKRKKKARSEQEGDETTRGGVVRSLPNAKSKGGELSEKFH